MSIIQRTFNVCFPRSGHRFLRNICEVYFGRNFKFRENHQKSGFNLEDANYIKDHDFGLLNNNKGILMLPKMKYLIQYCHPLETLLSYFEFQVKHGLLSDSLVAWENFFPKHLDYWKRFVGKWCMNTQNNDDLILHKVRYSDLYFETFATTKKVIIFLTNDQALIDQERLEKAVAQFKSGFARYVEDLKCDNALIKKARDIQKFKYFSQAFYELEEELKPSFLEPLGIKPILTCEHK